MIAIVGMACMLPGAPDLETYFDNLRAGVDAISDVPETRWNSVFYDPAAASPDRFYCKRGGFIDGFARFDAPSFGVMPVAASGAEPDQLLTLEVATRALADAGYMDRPFARDRAGVILGRGNYPGAGRARLDQHVRTAEQLVTCLRDLLPQLSETELLRVKREFQSQIPGVGADAAIGLVPNLSASRISHRLDLHGPAFTVDAACASSLLAVDQACTELSAKRSDLVLAGGVHLCHDETFWSVFCQLGALSRAQQIRPFDRRADGLLIGEGIGIIVLKRLEDAERDNDRIYAVIRGTGVASDGRDVSLMTPRVEGQVLALERAWKAAKIDPNKIGLLEAHGTGTNAGDAAEVSTLQRFFGPAEQQRAVLGSVKSMIGHAMPAAGIAGLIKAALAVHHGVLFPSLHCEEPLEALEQTRFRVLSRSEPWEDDVCTAGVNAFGFGGINAHVVLECHGRASRTSVASRDEKLALFAADTREALLEALASGCESSVGQLRVALTDPTAERRERAQKVVEKDRPWRGRDGIWFSPERLNGRLAFLFPGVDAAFEPRVEDVAKRFGSDVPACTRAQSIEEIGLGIISVNRLLFRVLSEMGLSPDVVAGHSIGEWSGMIATGIIPEDAVEEFAAKVKAGALQIPGVIFAAAGCSVERAERALESLSRIGISHDNCPHQVILCGEESAIEVALERLRADGVLCQKLPFQSGFHSPLFAPYLGPHREHFERLVTGTPKTKLWSATRVAAYPAEPHEICKLALEHLIEPVRFRELIEQLYEQGVRLFVQVGTGSLVQFVEDTLRGRPHVAISANVKERSGLSQLKRVAAQLFVEGVEMRLDKLEPARSRASMKLALGAPLIRLHTPLSVKTTEERPALKHHPLAAEFAETMAAIGRAQADVLAALSTPEFGARAATFVRKLSVETFPELIDHSFFRQPPGWTNVSDRHPVVPMTMSIELFIEAAQTLVPELKVVEVEAVRAFRWLVVSTPVDAQIACRFDGRSRVHVSIDGYCEGTLVLAQDYPAPPAPDTGELEGAAPAGLSARELYDKRWMFHGPAFQGIVDVGVVGDRAIRGVLQAGEARGALLDNAGQLFGYWVMIKNDVNRMAMPVKIDRIRFYGTPPSIGEKLTCTARIRQQDDREVIADLSLAKAGSVWVSIEGWTDRRFDTDERLWQVLTWPEKSVLSQREPGGFMLFHDHYRSAPTRDQLARRYLSEAERAAYDKQTPRKQRAWLSGRIAAKDAVRDLLWQLGHGEMFPVEIQIENLESGQPVVRGAPRDIRISLAHKGDYAVAIAAEARNVGVDLERIEPRSQSFASLSFLPNELSLLAASEWDEGLTRLWAAKEAAAKTRGTGLQGNPLNFCVRDRTGERLLVGETWVETRRYGDFIVSFTVP